MTQRAVATDHVLYRDFTRDYPSITRAEGVFLYDDQGRRYVDCAAGAANVNVAHGLEEVAEAMKKQACQVAFVTSFRMTTPLQAAISAKLAALAPGNLEYVFFVCSGSEANETALKLARLNALHRGEPQRYKLIARWQSYHGATIAALSMSGSHPLRRTICAPYVLDFPHIVPPNCYRCPFNATHPECDLACARELERAIMREGQETIAAFIAEPIVGNILPNLVPPDGYYQIIREICDKYGVLFVADEVMAGMGRSGEWFSINHWGVVPDIITFGKGVTSGYAPVSGIIASDSIVGLLLEKGGGAFDHGHTYSAHPVGLAAGLKVLEIFERLHLVERSREEGKYLFAKLEALRESPFVGEIRGKGLWAGIEFVRNQKTKEPFSRQVRFTERFLDKAMEKGFYFLPGNGCADGINGDGIQISPPLTIPRGLIDDMVAAIGDTLRELERELA